MEWLWIPAVALVVVFIFALCWLFYKDYTCCPCKNTRLQSSDVESGESRSESRSVSSFTTIDFNTPRSLPLPRTYPTSPAARGLSFDGSTEGHRDLPFRKHPPTVPKRLTPHLATLIDYDFGDHAHSSNIVRMELGAPTIDLHLLRVREARQVTETFLKQSRGKYRRVRIITGRGLHSVDGVPKIKPAVESLLSENNYSFKETAKGGCLEVML